jgi:hypothetical protein
MSLQTWLVIAVVGCLVLCSRTVRGGTGQIVAQGVMNLVKNVAILVFIWLLIRLGVVPWDW